MFSIDFRTSYIYGDVASFLLLHENAFQQKQGMYKWENVFSLEKSMKIYKININC